MSNQKTTTTIRLALRQAAILLLAPALAACAAEPAAQPRAAAAAAPALLEQIRAEIGDAACSNSSGGSPQCRTLAIGAKSCGGPESYLAWSTLRSDGAKLERLAAAYKTQREAENRREGRVSNCMFVADPGAQCVAGRCQLGGFGDGGLLR